MSQTVITSQKRRKRYQKRKTTVGCIPNSQMPPPDDDDDDVDGDASALNAAHRNTQHHQKMSKHFVGRKMSIRPPSAG